MVLTGALTRKRNSRSCTHKHGDGVKATGFRVRDAKSFETAIERGARVHKELEEHEDENAVSLRFCIHLMVIPIHKFIERQDYNGPFAPASSR